MDLQQGREEHVKKSRACDARSLVLLKGNFYERLSWGITKGKQTQCAVRLPAQDHSPRGEPAWAMAAFESSVPLVVGSDDCQMSRLAPAF